MKEYAHIFRALIDGQQCQLSIDGNWFDIAPRFAARFVVDSIKPERLRIKPETITINGHEVPAPLREAPAAGSDVFMPHLSDTTPVCHLTWHGYSHQQTLLARGLLHTTESNCEAHVEALLSFTNSLYATAEQSQSAISPDNRTPAEKELDAMVQEEIDSKGYDLHSINDIQVLRSVALRLLEERSQS